MSQNSWPKLAAIALVAGMIALPARSQTPSPLPLPNPYHIDETFKLEVPSGWKSLGGAGALKIGDLTGDFCTSRIERLEDRKEPEKCRRRRSRRSR